MTIKAIIAGSTALAVVALSLGGSAAIAQTQGTTSGPATGGNVQPSAATQKQNPAAADDPAKAGSVATGAAGVTAHPGAEAGPPPARPAPK
jgi:hypothetical protein